MHLSVLDVKNVNDLSITTSLNICPGIVRWQGWWNMQGFFFLLPSICCFLFCDPSYYRKGTICPSFSVCMYLYWNHKCMHFLCIMTEFRYDFQRWTGYLLTLRLQCRKWNNKESQVLRTYRFCLIFISYNFQYWDSCVSWTHFSLSLQMCSVYSQWPGFPCRKKKKKL